MGKQCEYSGFYVATCEMLLLCTVGCMCESSPYSCNLDVKRPKSEVGGGGVGGEMGLDWTSNPNLRNAYGRPKVKTNFKHCTR